jgi:hypothetical protein
MPPSFLFTGQFFGISFCDNVHVTWHFKAGIKSLRATLPDEIFDWILRLEPCISLIYEGKSENKVPYFIASHGEVPLYSLITHFTSLFFHIVTFSVDVKESEVSNKW